MAEATVGRMLALCRNIRAKDNVARTAGWESRRNLISSELRDHTFGAVGLGRIARKTIELLKGFAMNPAIAFDPFVREADAAALGVRLVSLDRLMSEADFVSVHCPLSDGTRNLIGEKEIALMKPTAFLINTARGGIVNEDALFSALQEQRIAGAALDCFVGEPLTTPPPVRPARQRADGTALHRLYPRAVSRYRAGGVPGHDRPGPGQKAPGRAQP